MTNIAAARRVIALARDLGVEDFCVCGGSRNAPLIAVLGELVILSRADGEGSQAAQIEILPLRGVHPEAPGGRRRAQGQDDGNVYSFVDERSAAFFALGRAKLTERPVAVITTSGTASAELLPAAIEAHYSGTPLILITADRPARYRGTGAPQAIEQEAIFGVYAARDAASWQRLGPLHINVEFDEPLIDEDCHPESFVGSASSGQAPRGIGVGGWRASDASVLRPPTPIPRYARDDKPLVILSGLAARDRDRARDFVLSLGAPVYAEPLSGLREDPSIAHLAITAGERMIARGGFDRVIRIGGVPALRFWRDLDESRRDLPVVSYSRLPFRGLSRGELVELALPAPEPVPRDDSFFREDREKAVATARILDEEPRSELAMVRDLSRSIPKQARVYLGNSLPIREWDLVATREPRGFAVEANRGANGIDGQLSTFFGQCERGRENVAVVGDLTAIYDSNAPWIVPQLDASWRIAIINNGGGRIFERVASLRALDPKLRDRLIENAHGFRFDQWAAMWNIADRVTELRPDADASRRAWERYDALW